jgi:hypothetical protein
MGDRRKQALQVRFDGQLRLESHGAKVTSDAGLLQNRKALMNLPGMWTDRVRRRRALDKLILDLDSSVSEPYGRQEGSAQYPP